MSITTQHDDYIKIAKKYNIPITHRGLWILCGHSSQRTQGWKLHISIVQSEAEALLHRIIPIFYEHSVSFKFAKNPIVLSLLNEGNFGNTQIGKFITIYPSSDTVAVHLATTLIELTSDLHGPEIITDLYLGGTVYARYGGFDPFFERNRLGQTKSVLFLPDGSYRPDNYTVPYLHPEFPCPFTSITDTLKNNNHDQKVIGSGYILLSVITKNPKGFVYLSLDVRLKNEANLVILKEGRKYCNTDSSDRDARDRLKHQANIHSDLCSLDCVPKCYEYFEFEGNGYLSIEYIDGIDLLRTYSETPYRMWSKKERHQKLNIMYKICQAIYDLHKMGYIHRDLTPRNIRIASNERIYLLDFELAWSQAHEGTPFMQGTPGFASPQQIDYKKPSFEDDIFSIGAVMIWMFLGIDPQHIPTEELLQRKERIEQLAGTPTALTNIIGKCLEPIEENRPSIKEIMNVIKQIQHNPTTHKKIVKIINFQEASNDSITIENVRNMVEQLMPDAIRYLSR